MRKVFEITPILNLVDTRPAEFFYEEIESALSRGEKRFVVTLNPEMLMSAAHSTEMEDLLTSDENIKIPDGIGIVYALRKIDKNLQVERNTGIDLVEHLLSFSHATGLSIFVYGTTQRNLHAFETMIKKRFSGIKSIMLCDGFQENESSVREAIFHMNPDIILVALGTPKQELFIASIYHELEKGVCVGVGGSIDVVGGAKKRAPGVIRKANLEWLYRILCEPRRLKRFLTGNTKYAASLFKEGLL